MFKINGYCHGQSIFTDELHYILKGAKFVKCTMESLNRHREWAYGVREYFGTDHFVNKDHLNMKITNLPKSFGLEIGMTDVPYTNRLLQIKNVDNRLHVSKLFFNFNINSFILRENMDYYCFKRYSSPI